MIKYYCEICFGEIPKDKAGRYIGEKTFINADHKKVCVNFEIMTAINGMWNKGEICRKCLLEALNNPDEEIPE